MVEGNLELADRARQLRIPHDHWTELNDEQRRKVFNKFVRFRPKSSIVESTDGLLTIPTTARLAKKPGQVKRVRNSKTSTFGKRPKI